MKVVAAALTAADSKVGTFLIHLVYHPSSRIGENHLPVERRARN